MAYIGTVDPFCMSLARKALAGEKWLARVSDDRDRYVSDLAAKIAEAVNEELNHYRETLGSEVHQ